MHDARDCTDVEEGWMVKACPALMRQVARARCEILAMMIRCVGYLLLVAMDKSCRL